MSSVTLDLPEVSRMAKRKGSYPNVKLEPEVHRLAEKVAVHKEIGISALCNAILKEALGSMWQTIGAQIAAEMAAESPGPKRKGSSA